MILLDPEIKIEPYNGTQIMKNIERACRTCYRSEDKTTDTSYQHLLKNCINRGHESVLEHEKITTQMLTDVGVYKDLTRHRHASFSIESTRYCNYGKDKFGNEIKFIKPVYFGENKALSTLWYEEMAHIEDTYMKMVQLGAKPDEMRMILPHSTAAVVNMTADIREWRHILELRCDRAAHPAVRQVMIPLLLRFQKDMPELFNEIEYDKDFDPEKYAKLSVIKDERGIER